MGYPTFTFETDDEQWLLGTAESLSDRLGEELEVMRYLIDNVWSWRARLEVQSIVLTESRDELTLDIDNLGRATTANATLQYFDSAGEIVWNSSNFSVNATNSSQLSFDASNLSMTSEGTWELRYQVRIVESARWVSEPVDAMKLNIIAEDETSFLIGYGLFNPVTIIVGFVAVAALVQREHEEEN
jgi:hypothetical protein